MMGTMGNGWWFANKNALCANDQELFSLGHQHFGLSVTARQYIWSHRIFRRLRQLDTQDLHSDVSA